MNRTLAILGVQEGQVFRYTGEVAEYRVANNRLELRWKGSDDWIGARSESLMALINDPGKIVRSVALTSDQQQFLSVLRRYLGIKYVTRDLDGTIGLHIDLPEKRLAAWYSMDRQSIWSRVGARQLSPLVEWENPLPLSVDDILNGRVKENNITQEETTHE